MFQLSCRERDAGRGLVPVAPTGGWPDPSTAGLAHWVIFVHGYNNSENSAAAGWIPTISELRRLGVALTDTVFFYWPGDYTRWEAVSAMLYPLCVPIAQRAASLLVEFLSRAASRRTQPLQVSFVAHSLGSLVALEASRLLREDRENVEVRNLLLLAAAVPEGLCVPGERYGLPFGTSTRETALYSLDDTVLKRYFQVGQTLARRLPRQRRRAVGRCGGPSAGQGGRWHAVAHMEGLDHGEYWSARHVIAEIAPIVAPSFAPPISVDELADDTRRLHAHTLSSHTTRKDALRNSSGTLAGG